MDNDIKKRSRTYYIVFNIMAIISSYIVFEYIYFRSDKQIEYVKKAGKYVKLTAINYKPALIYSLIVLGILVIILALLYKKTNFFDKLSSNIGIYISKLSSVSPLSIDIKSMLSLEDMKATRAIKYLYYLSILLASIKFIVSMSGLYDLISLGFAYSMRIIFTTSLMSIATFILALIVLKLIFILLYNIFLLLEKNL